MRHHKNIYTITTLNIEPAKRGSVFKNWGSTKDTRCWGWFPSLKAAQQGLKQILWTGSRYAVIEEFRSGPLAIASKEHWFEATYKDHVWGDDRDDYSRCPGCDGPPKIKKIKKPKAIQQIVSFGMG